MSIANKRCLSTSSMHRWRKRFAMHFQPWQCCIRSISLVHSIPLDSVPPHRHRHCQWGPIMSKPLADKTGSGQHHKSQNLRFQSRHWPSLRNFKRRAANGFLWESVSAAPTSFLTGQLGITQASLAMSMPFDIVNDNDIVNITLTMTLTMRLILGACSIQISRFNLSSTMSVTYCWGNYYWSHEYCNFKLERYGYFCQCFSLSNINTQDMTM